MFKFLEKYPEGTTTNDLTDIDYLTYAIMTGDISESEVIAQAKSQGNRIELSNGCVVKQNGIGHWEVEFDADGYRDSMGIKLFLAISHSNYGEERTGDMHD